MPEDRDPALDPAPERADRLFPPAVPTDPASGSRRTQADGHDDDRLFPRIADDGDVNSGSASTKDSAERGDADTRDEGPVLGADGDPGADGYPYGDGDPDARSDEDARADVAPGADVAPTERHDEASDDAVGGGAASTSASGAGAASGQPPRKRAKGANSFLRELPVLLLIAFVLAFVLRTFVVQVFYIPSGSMEPTLQVDDRMLVEKITYRFREPDRGEVAVFEGESFGELDTEASAGERLVRGVGQFLGLVPASARDFVKRVVGLPGDEILIEGGTVFVNGDALDEPYVVFEDPTDFGPVTVPDGQLFFLGDNRPNSSDSRRSLGYVSIDAVVGRAAFIIWPPDNAASLTGTEYRDEVDVP